MKVTCFGCLGTIVPDDVGKYLVAAERLEGENKLVEEFVTKAEELSGPTPKLTVCESCAKQLGLKVAEKAKELFPMLSLGVFGAEPQETNDG